MELRTGGSLLPTTLTLNPSFAPPIIQFPSLLTTFSNLFHKPPTLKSQNPKPLLVISVSRNSAPIVSQNQKVFSSRWDIRSFAGRSKKLPSGSSAGRNEGNAGFRRDARGSARRRSKKLVESLFYRLKNPNRNYPDNFSEEELQAIGLGYDRMVRFMDKDDPNLRHPYDWYKYGEFGPFSWQGIVLGDPIRGRFSDERVTLISDVKDHEEWEKIEQFEMGLEFRKRLKQMDKSKGFRYFWVFVRHPKWRISDLPWQQWTLVCEVVVEAGKQRLDKWNLMGRLGNKARSLITKCAAWMRPDIIYVKRPVYQCRFEPQDNFFKALIPFLDPSTEQNYLFELRNDDDGSVETCTYFGGLCKILRVNPKAFVDDVVKAYVKLSDEKKSKCLEFLLTNHPVELLHPYTKEWKAKLEEMELGCDAPEDDDDVGASDPGEIEILEWIEDDEDGDDDDDDDDDDGDDEDIVMDMEEGSSDDEVSAEEEDTVSDDDDKQWVDEFRKTVSSAEAMERLARQSVELSSQILKQQVKTMEAQSMGEDSMGGDENALRGKRAKVSREEWKIAGIGPWRRRIKKSKIPPELFLRAAVRPFTYRNLVKEIVLTRHAILDGDIGNKA